MSNYDEYLNDRGIFDENDRQAIIGYIKSLFEITMEQISKKDRENDKLQ